jgi:hypothetical protein
MSRITLAFSAFFRLLFGGKLPARAVDYLPDDAKLALLPAKEEKAEAKKPTKSKSDADKPADKKPAAPKVDKTAMHREGALALLSLLQREGRLVDFLREDIDDYEDEDIGAAVRDIHRGCRKVIDEHLEIEAVMPGDEDDDVTIPKGFDAGEVKLIGEVEGDPPFKGVLKHHGWRATKIKLPTLSDGVDRNVLAAAEVELS